MILQILATKKEGLVTQTEAEVMVEAVLKSDEIPLLMPHLQAE